MENVYWWIKAGMNKLEKGEFYTKSPELEEKIGPVSFSKPQFASSWPDQFGWLATGKNGGKTIVYQTPWNCGQLTMCGLAADGEAIVLQDLLTDNIAIANGYKVLTASAYPNIIENWLAAKLGWIDCGSYTGRYSEQMRYIIKPVDYRGHPKPMGQQANGFVSINS